MPYKAVDILAEAAKREAVKAYTKWPTIPQVFVGGKFIGGCDIVREMHAKGELASLVKAAVAKASDPFGGAGRARRRKPPHGRSCQRSRSQW